MSARFETGTPSAMPDAAPLTMPRAPLHGARHRARERRGIVQRFGVALARAYVIAVTLALSGYGTLEMYQVMATVGPTGLQWLFLALFSVNFLWISASLAQASLALFRAIPGVGRRARDDDVVPAVTAILVPAYNEDPCRIAAAIATMSGGLAEAAPQRFAFFVLSDTNSPDAWVRELAVMRTLCQSAPAGCPVYYRHRPVNVERKAGNIAEWVEHWGGAYEAMVVLDADSLMTPATLLALARRMAADPGLGLIQTLPRLVRGRTLYARLQQFAAACYGPVFANGLAAWYGSSGNFWGHNAIIRVRAFADACRLPELPGAPPLGGHIMSHDFVEAALLRRAGWAVRFDTDLGGSYEESPPSLIDALVRDRRWCQGNLQHARVLLARGLRLPSRLHLLTGIMTYLSAVLWMLLLAVGLALALQAAFSSPSYFDGPSLFPKWPVFDAERALRLFVVSMAVLLGPKLLGWLRALLQPRAFGNPLSLTASVLFETLLSALYAPILMVSQTTIVLQVLSGRSSGWLPQRRDSGADPWPAVWRAHRLHVAFGTGIALAGGLLSLDLFLWLLPFTAGLVLAPLLSRLSGSAAAGRALRWLTLLRSPEERRSPAPLNALDSRLQSVDVPETGNPLACLAGHPELRRWQLAQLPDGPPDPEQPIDVNHVVALEKVARTGGNLDELNAWLTRAECLSLLKDREYVAHLGDAPAWLQRKGA